MAHTSEQDQKIIDGFKDYPSDFNPTASEVAFLQATTGIKDEQELKQHVVAVQRKALQVFPYPCIVVYTFVQSNISNIRGFAQALQLAKERPGALLLDAGCCFGADARKAVLEGFPPTQIIASDIHAPFWDLGHELFRDTQGTMPITFLAGDVFDPSFLAASPLALALGGVGVVDTPLSELTTLTALRGRLSAVHASLFFHMFSRERQELLARLLGSLIIPEKGSVIFGHQMGDLHEGTGAELGKWAHSRESWKMLWEQTLAELGWRGAVQVQTRFVQAEAFVASMGLGGQWLYWTVELL